MTKVIISAIVGVIVGLLLMATVAEIAAESRDRAIVSSYIASQSQSARVALAARDLATADRLQRNAIDAAERGSSALAFDSAPWTFWFPLAAGVVSAFASDSNTDAMVRKQQEVGLRLMHADILEQLGRVEEATTQRQQAARLKK